MLACSLGGSSPPRGYAVSQRIRKRIEEGFGWAKTIGGIHKLKHRGLAKVDFQFTLTFAAYNLVRLRTLASALEHVPLGSVHLCNGHQPDNARQTPLSPPSEGGFPFDALTYSYFSPFFHSLLRSLKAQRSYCRLYSRNE